jgi:hypothetical protein
LVHSIGCAMPATRVLWPSAVGMAINPWIRLAITFRKTPTCGWADLL